MSASKRIAVSIASTPPKQEQFLGQLRTILGTVDGFEFVFSRSDAEMPSLVKDCQILLTDKLTPEVFAAAPQLEWVQLIVAGVEASLFPAVLESGVEIANSRGMHVEQMAEHTLGVMLAHSRGLPECFRAQQAKEWRQRVLRKRNFTLSGLTVGILGLGAIGQGIATRCAHLGMTVIGTKRITGEKVPGVDRVYGPEGLHTVLKESDFLVVVLPLTKETRHLLGARELALMKKDAYLVNISRGIVIEEFALIDALRNGRLSGAALDVFEKEPLPADSPLWEMENCLITPHCSGNYPNYVQDSIDIFARNLKRYRDGEKLENLVDKKRGY